MKRYLMNTQFGQMKQEEQEAIAKTREDARKQDCKFISCLSEIFTELQSENVVLEASDKEQLLISVF